MVGFVFFPKSPRNIGFEAARALGTRARGRARIVALTVDPDDALLQASSRRSTPTSCNCMEGEPGPGRGIGARFGRLTMKAIGVATPEDLVAAGAYDGAADFLLIDAKPPKGAVLPGGNGLPFDWRLARDFAPRRPWLLSGGLNSDNVAEAIRADRRPRRRRVVGRRARARRQGRSEDCGLCRRRARGFAARERWSALNGQARQAQFLPQGARRARALRHLRRPVRRRDADAADPVARKAYEEAKADPAFHAELNGLLKHYVGRPSPLYFAERLTEHLGGAKVYFKRDELNHTGAHKINNVLGQILLARRMGKQRIIAETGAGQHGVATATACARFGLDCVVYMGAVDVERQKPNVFRMNLLGAEVRPVEAGARTLKDAINEAMRDWVTNVADTFYCIGTAAGPHPYPMMVRDFQCVIGDETREQMLEAEGRLPDASSPRSAAGGTPSASSTRSSTTRASRCSASKRPGTARRRQRPRRLDRRRPSGRPARQPQLPVAG